MARAPWIDSTSHTQSGRMSAALLVLGATWRYNRSEPSPAAFIAIPVALMATGTLATLIAPVAPRIVWRLAAAALPLSLALAAVDSGHG